jgi:spore coat protein CotF
MPRHGKNPFYKERNRLNQINESIDYMEEMMPKASIAVRAVLQKNIDRSRKEAKNILNQMILDGYTGENHGRS